MVLNNACPCRTKRVIPREQVMEVSAQIFTLVFHLYSKLQYDELPDVLGITKIYSLLWKVLYCNLDV